MASNSEQIMNSASAPSSPNKGNRNSAFYGMLRKTRKKIGGRKHNRNVSRDDSSSDSSVGPGEGVVLNGGSLMPQLTPQGTRADAAAASGMDTARSFYFSPLNSWTDHGRRTSKNDTYGKLQQQNHPADNSDGIEAIVHSVERGLRQVVICCVMFIAGTIMSDRAPVAYHMLELSLVAWGTCLLIVALGWYQNYKNPRSIQSPRDTMLFGQSAATPLMSNARTSILAPPPAVDRVVPGAHSATDRQAIFTAPSTETEYSKKRSHDELVELAGDSKPPLPKVMRESTQQLATTSTMPAKQQHQMKQHEHQKKQHPELENLYVMMVGKQERIFPNMIASEIDNELFSGKMLLMFRTPEVDDPNNTPSTDPVVNYFRGKQRRFEFQWQLRLKKAPEGDVFLNAELDEPIRMGMIQRALANGALKFVKKMNQGFSYSLSDTSDVPSYLSFPVGTSMDRFNATKIGEPLPVLGQAVNENSDTMKERKKGKKIEWKTDHVYTMALWSAYLDWLDWEIMNFPGIRPFSVTSVAGVQPIKLILAVSSEEEAAKKNPCRDVVFAMEVSNAVKSTIGSEASQWNADIDTAINEQQPSPISDAVINAIGLTEVDSTGQETFDEDEDEFDEEEYDDKPMDEVYIDDEEEEEAALELDTFGCYLLSGTPVSLSEGTGNYVASGGGYAVLQSSPTSLIVLEKFQAKKKKKGASPGSSTMIRSGDVVRVKLIDSATKLVKFLTVHRGWWLRWNSVRPKRNGMFYIHTAEPNGSLVVLGSPFSLISRRWSQYTIGACSGSSAKYGGRLLGIYKTGKRTSNDDAGDEEEIDGPMQDNEFDDKESPVDKSKDKRMQPLLLCAEAYQSVDGEYPAPVRSPDRISTLETMSSVEDVKAVQVPGSSGTEHVQKRYEIDVPVWLETLNRTTRTKQIFYAVRVKETVLTKSNNDKGTKDSEAEAELPDEVSTSRMFLKLRTGRDLTPILRLGVDYKSELSPTSSDQWQQRFGFNNEDELNDADSFASSSDDSDSDEEMDDDSHHFLIAGPNHSDTFASDEGDRATDDVPDDFDIDNEARTSPSPEDHPTNSAMEQDNGTAESGHSNIQRKGRRLSIKLNRQNSTQSDTAGELLHRDSSMSGTDAKRGSFSHTNSKQEEFDRHVSTESKKKIRLKHGAVIGRVAKTVKSSTVVTGKHVIKHSKNIGKGTVKGTVSALTTSGRVAVGVIPTSVQYYKPPRKHEPGGRVHRKKSDKRQMKMIGRAIKMCERQGNFSSSLLSGQLLPPDQSCRKVSQILLNISSASHSTAQDAISLLARTNSAQDLSFLRGSSAELGVKPLKPIDPKFDVSTVIARCIYEGRWREELCVLYTKESQHIAFYAPLDKKPDLVISFSEIMSVRKCGMNTEQSPLPGVYALAIDTSWKCHYLVFLEESQRDDFMNKLKDALFNHMGDDSHPKQTRKVAQEFERYRMSLENVLTGEAGKWCAVSTGKKSKQKKQRRILNSRRMAFDLDPVTDEQTDSKSVAQGKIASYVENLLRMALSFSPDDSLDASDSRFIDFLDETSKLRTLPLHEIDRDSKEAFCIFVNLHHCLLQHSLLLAVDGLPNKRSVLQFKRCSCYEIGEDVFSLAELECCVIRGKTSKPSHPKPPFVEAPKKSMPYRMMYALGATDFRVNFILHNGDMTHPSAIPVLNPQTMEDLIDSACSVFLTDQQAGVKIDKRKRTVFLPKVCDVYRNDFGMGDGLVCLSQCLIYLEESDQLAIAALLEDGVVSVKFNES